MEAIALQRSFNRSLLVEIDPMNAVVHSIPVRERVVSSRSGVTAHNAVNNRESSPSRVYIPFSDYELDPDAPSCSILENVRKLLQTQRSKGRFERFKR